MNKLYLPKSVDQSSGPACIDIQSGPSNTEMHYHSCAEIIYMREGEANIFVQDKWCTITENDAVFLPPGHIHCCKCADDAASRIVIGLEEELIHRLSDDNDITRLPFRAQDFSAQFIFKNNIRLKGMFSQLYKLEDAETISDRLKKLTVVEQIFCEMLAVWESEGVLKEGVRMSECTQMILNIISDEYKNDITAEQVARKINISYSYMATLLARELKTNFCTLLFNKRISEAKRLLLTTDKSITAVAMESGFTDSSYFIKKFKALTATTPFKYRNDNLNKI
ncbi:MAG: AraC family transcriptional regulator [Clostridia bacterium]|nr:AraC family transcriptional regulator [Clostridia bacterium]